MLAQEQNPITVCLLRALTRVYPNTLAVFGIDGMEVGAEEMVLKIASRFSDSLQAYLYICHVLRMMADMMLREGYGELVPNLLRLQELVHP
jgi:hypothetical protein